MCYDGLCRCKRGYEESFVNPGQCLPSSLNDVQSPFEPLPGILSGDQQLLLKLNDILNDDNEHGSALDVARTTLTSGKRASNVVGLRVIL